MKKILAFGASSSKKSINQKLARYAATLMDGVEVSTIDLNDYEMPIYSVDRQSENGIPDAAVKFKKSIAEADGIILSLAEHNGTYTAAFKNIYDWASKVEKSMWLDKPMVLLSTSPGGRGGITALEIAVERFGYMGGKVVGSLAVPNFYDNYSEEEGLKDTSLHSQLSSLMKSLDEKLST